METKKGERLQVVLARFGIASRRGVVSLIEAGQVTVNGQVVREKGFRVHSPNDKVAVNDREIATADRQEKKYFVLHKPKGVMTTRQDPHAERTVMDFLGDVPERVFPVGRLDKDTTGLLLLTNDGELAFRLTHPGFGVEKRYRAVVKGAVAAREVEALKKGVLLEEGKTAPCKIEIESARSGETGLIVTLHEGKKRQIRRMFDKIGHRVKELTRLNYGTLSLGDLRPGEKRELRPQEVRELRRITGLEKRG
ncbi:MAG: rRNA pseudouridine synthase [Candidatus Omnitrophica bacterium]|nr:rRNA pseudouridine synthase [Candidatus Omnitrophota bacterium]